MFTAMLLLSQALAANIGVERSAIPEEPMPCKPQVSGRVRQGQIFGGDLEPRVLVPCGYTTGKVNFWGRYYDEAGNVYRSGEVYLILERDACCMAEVQEAQKYSMRTTAAAVGVIACTPIFPINMLCLIPEMMASQKARQATERALVKYNQARVEESSPPTKGKR